MSEVEKNVASTGGGGRVNYCVWCSGPVGYGGAHAYQICRDIYGRETLITSHEDFYKFCFHEEYKEEDTYDEVIKKIRDEYIKKIRREEKILWGVGIYFLASLPILFVLPPILFHFHLISKAMVGLISALWLGLYLGNLVGAVGYLLEVRDAWDRDYCCDEVLDMAELIVTLYLLLFIAFAIVFSIFS